MPNKVKVYVFGSVMRNCNPNDIDIIVIYDSIFYPKYTIADICKELLVKIQEVTNLKVDVTYLSEIEEQNSKFITEVGAIPLEAYLLSLDA